jgi:Domain of unknown function (DUF4956)
MHLDPTLQELLVQIGLNLLSMFVLVRLIYYPIYRNTEFAFTYFIFNIIIFFVTYLLNKVNVSMGAAFGLFAVFSMLRYRTEGISMRDMTYLFLTIALGLIHGITVNNTQTSAIISVSLLLLTYLFESNILYRREFSKEVMYDKIDLTVSQKRQELIADLEERTGLKINRVEVEKLDFLRDMAYLKIYYYAQ